MRVLIVFTLRHPSFRLPELDALLELQGLRPQDVYGDAKLDREEVFLEAQLPGQEAAQAICERCMLVRQIFELWGRGADTAAAVEDALAYPAELKAPWLAEDVTWSLSVSSFGVSYSREEQEAVRLQFEPLGWRGRVRLKKPDSQFFALMQHGIALDGESHDELRHVYLGRLLAERRQLLKRYTLKKRAYLGPTSMDSRLSLVMANLAKCEAGQFVYDPFVGTGSLLVAAAHFGCYTMGTDIDPLILRGRLRGNRGARKVGKMTVDNFKQYGLPIPELIRGDVSFSGMLRDACLYDAIICDPPYGLRAGARKLAAKRVIPAEHIAGHITATQVYAAEDVMADLLDTAARTLVLGGRLVFVMALLVPWSDADLPSHPCLRLVSACEQVLQRRLCRLVITMEKVSAFDSDVVAAHHGALRAHFERLLSSMREVIMAHASFEEKVARKKQKKIRTAHREALPGEEEGEMVEAEDGKEEEAG
eukprot:PLAT12816.1.p1 GENE.PLAT12816.1~~PLAT12816.1.p1  ORF type:complete len:478 (+),score=221.31 PLAT12816.1:78-1511(+)